MKTNKRSLFSLAFLGIALISAPGYAFTVPLRFGIMQPVVDEFGHVLPGTASATGAKVLILSADTNGVVQIHPPAYDGSPHPNNIILGIAYIGQGADPGLTSGGQAFGSVLIDRSKSTPMFARIYNRPTLEDSTFYVDSPIYTNSTTRYGVFQIVVAQTLTPIDPRDFSGNGLNNSWERSLGTDPWLWDTDGDGVSDYDEMMAGTDALDPASYLAVDRMASDAVGNLWVEWSSAIGHTYQLQRSTNSLNDPGLVFDPVNQPILADDVVTSTTVTNETPVGHQFFRVRVLEPEEP